jgi:NAD-dependent deacetylase
MTDVAEACEEADIMLLLGGNMFNEKLEFQVDPENNPLKILFSKDDFINNRKVDFIIRDDINTFLPLVLE